MLLFTTWNNSNKDDFKSFLDWTGGIAQWVKHLCKHEVLSSITQNSHKARDSSVSVCKPSMPMQRLAVETGQSWEVKRLANMVYATEN